VKIKQLFNKKKKTIIIIAVILLVVIGALAGRGGEVLEVDAYVVDQGTVMRVIEETATVMTRDDRVIEALVTAEIKFMEVEIGDVVKKGDALAVLNVEDVDYQIKTLYAQKKSLNATLADSTHTDPEQLEKALAQIRSAEANLDDANRDLASNQTLYDAGAISKDAYEKSVNSQIVKREAVEITKQSYELLKKGISNDLKRKYLADIEAISHQISQMESTKNKYAIMSPINGIVTDKFVEEGDYLQPGTSVIEIANLGAMYLETDVLASDMSNIKVGTRAQVDDEDLDIQLTSFVDKVHPKAFSKTSDLGIEQKRVKLEMAIKNPRGLTLGYEIDVDIIEEQSDNVIRVPDSATFKINREWHVFVIEDDKAVLRVIEVGVEGRDFYEVLSGLKTGEKIVDSPPNELTENAAVIVTNEEEME